MDEHTSNVVDFEKDQDVLKELFQDELGASDRQMLLTYDEKQNMFWLVKLNNLDIKSKPVSFNVCNTDLHHSFTYRNGVSQYDLIGRLITYLLLRSDEMPNLSHLNYDEILDELLEIVNLTIYDLYAPKYFFKD